MPQRKLTYVDLFAGIGGFAAAFEALGLDNALAVEFDSDAADVYKDNWGHSSFGDVTKVAPESGANINHHTVLSAGFPCQPFSKSGAQLGVLDKSRGTLFRNVLSAIESGKPKVVILENVRNLAGPKHSGDLEIILESLRALGYRVSSKNTFVSPHKIHPDFGGRPQSRERLFIAATLVPAGYSGSMDVDPLDIYGDVPLKWEAQSWNPKLAINATKKKSDLSIQDLDVLEAWQDFVEIFTSQDKPVPNLAIWTEFWGTSPNLDQFPSWKANLVRRNLDLYEANKTKFDAWAAKHKIFESPSFNPSKRKFEWQAQDMPSIYEGIVHFRPSGVRVKKFDYFPALVAITHIPILGPYKRRMDLDEARRLQGLPEWFSFGDKPPKVAFKQLGNGVNVGAVWRVLKSLAARDEDLLQMTAEGRQLLGLINAAPDSPDGVLASLRPSGR